MSIDSTIITAISLTVLGYFVAWYRVAPPLHAVPNELRQGYRVTSVLLVALVVNRMLILPGRSDAAALVDGGLSSANVATAVLVVGSTMWAAHLLASKRLDAGRLLSGAGLWLVSFVTVSALSVAWSSWPMLTGFRVLEIFCVALLIGHAVQCSNSPLWLERTMLLALATRIVSILVVGDVAPADLVSFAALRSNAGGVVAGILIVYYLTSIQTPVRTSAWLKLGAAIYAFVLFGSVASLFALVIATLCVMLLRLGPRIAETFALLGLFGIVVMASYFVIFPPAGGVSALADHSLVREYAEVVGKQPHHFANLTGRTPVWNVASDAVAKQPWGFGFAAGERLLPLTEGYDANWAATHAHNGFVAGYLSAGLVGLVVVGLVFLATAHRSSAPRVFVVPALIFMAVNNLAAAVLGSAFHPAWVALVLIVYWRSAPSTNPDFRVVDGRMAGQDSRAA